MLTPTPWSLKQLLPLRFSKNILVHNSPIHHIHHALHYYRCPLHDQPNNVQQTPHIMKLCPVQFPSATWYFLHPQFKQFTQLNTLKYHKSPLFSPFTFYTLPLTYL